MSTEKKWFEFSPDLIGTLKLQPILNYCEEMGVSITYDAYNALGLETSLRVKEMSPTNRHLERDTIELSKEDGIAWPIEVICHELGHLVAWRNGLDADNEVLAWDLGEAIFKTIYPATSLRRMKLIRKSCLKSYGIEE